MAIQDNTNDISDFRRMLPNLVSSQELNPEEEEHKQLTAILRSHRIRESLVHSTKEAPVSRADQNRQALVFFAKPFSHWLPLILVLVAVLQSAVENIPGKFPIYIAPWKSYNNLNTRVFNAPLDRALLNIRHSPYPKCTAFSCRYFYAVRTQEVSTLAPAFRFLALTSTSLYDRLLVPQSQKDIGGSLVKAVFG